MIKQSLILMSFLTASPIIALVDFPPVQAQQRSNWQPFLQRVVSRSPLPRKRGGGRTGVFSWEVLSPGVWSKQLWTLQPSLIWRSEPNAKLVPDRAEILPAGSSSPIWSQRIQPNRTIPMMAKLEPGKTYVLRFSKRNADLQKDEVIADWDFEMMTIAQRQKVIIALNRLDKQLKPLERLQRRIEILAAYGLWSDVVQEITRSNLSASDRQTAIKELLTQLDAAESNRTSN
jgi:hypothetical protein